MIGFLLALLALLLHPTTPAAPVPHGVTVSPVAPAPAEGVGVEPTRAVHPRAVSNRAPDRSAPLQAPAAPGVPQYRQGPRPEGLAAPTVAAPGPDSPVCDTGQTPALDGCAQGQLPDETTGRAYG